MAAYKDEERGTWYVSFHYNDWTGKNRRKLKSNILLPHNIRNSTAI